MAGERPYDLIDEAIHQRTRLSIMSVLSSVGRMEFNELKAELGLTDGNLSTHAAHLERTGYVKIKKTFKGKKPLTTIVMTARGRKAMEKYVETLTSILRGPP